MSESYAKERYRLTLIARNCENWDEVWTRNSSALLADADLIVVGRKQPKVVKDRWGEDRSITEYVLGRLISESRVVRYL